MRKKGEMSKPLAATFIVFISVIAIVSLGFFLKNLINKSSLNEGKLSLNCIQDVDVKILDACYKGNLFKITVRNEKDIILGNFFLVILNYKDGSTKAIPTAYHTYVQPYETKTITVQYYEGVEKIKLIPRIEEQSYLCENVAPEFENIKECKDET